MSEEIQSYIEISYMPNHTGITAIPLLVWSESPLSCELAGAMLPHDGLVIICLRPLQLQKQPFIIIQTITDTMKRLQANAKAGKDND